MSVRKREWTNTDGSTGEAWIVAYTDQDGKRRHKQFKLGTVKAPKREAESFAAHVRQQIAVGTHIPQSQSKTVAEAGDLWIKSGEAAGLQRATLVQYRQLLKLHIKPFIGGMKLSAISVPAVRAFEDRLREEGRSNSLVRKVTAALSSILADAQDRGLAAHNAVRERGKRKNGRKRSKREQTKKLKIGEDIPSLEEMSAALAAAGPHEKPFLMTAAMTGLRAGELRALCWRHIDLDKGIIQVVQRADRYNEIDSPKSEGSEREVPIGPGLVRTLKEWKLAYPRPLTGKRDTEGEPLRKAHTSEHLVFPNGIGKIERLQNIIDRIVIPTMIRAKVTKTVTGKDGKPKVTAKYTGMHSFRHFYASWCINRVKDGGLGLPPKIVQERLGHASITLTMDRYGHLFKSDDFEELATAESALLATKAQQTAP